MAGFQMPGLEGTDKKINKHNCALNLVLLLTAPAAESISPVRCVRGHTSNRSLYTGPYLCQKDQFHGLWRPQKMCVGEKVTSKNQIENSHS